MDINSPIGGLIEVIKSVIADSAKYEQKLKKNEAATRATLIDPVLRALGWDTANPNMIEFELNSGSTILDYALYDSSGKVRVIVEAKSLGGNLNDTNILFKLVSYCLTYGISNLFLTNGIVWQHFFDLQPGNINPIVINFLENPLVNCAGYLVEHIDAARFWTVDIKPVETWKPEQLEKTETKGQTPSQVDKGDFVLLESLPDNLTGLEPPKKLRLPDGSVKPILHWRDILSDVASFVLSSTPDIPVPLIDKAGKTRYLLNSEKPEKRGSIPIEYNGKQVFILISYSSNECVSNARYILNKLPPDMKKIPVAVLFS